MRHLKSLFRWTLGLLLMSSVAFALTTFFIRITPSAALHNSRDITFEFSADREDVRFVCGLDDADPTLCTSPKTYLGLLDGQHKFVVHAISDVEGPDYVGATHIWTIDTRPPLTSLTYNRIGPSAVQFDLFSDEPNSTFTCTMDQAPLAVCATPWIVENLSPGVHLFKAYAHDEAGNVDPIGAEKQFEIEKPIPATTHITRVTPRAEFTNQTAIVIEFESNQADATFRCTLNSQIASCVSPKDYSSLPDGAYLFKVQAIDRYGQLDPLGDSYAWTVDTVPPVGTYVVRDTTSTTAIISWTTNEPASTRLNWGPGGVADRAWPENPQMTTEHTVRVTGLSSYSTYSFQAGGVDRAGNAHVMPLVTLKTKR